ncbi:MAG: uL15 family ribosomal protein [Candidatus Nitrosocosmicus sp.]|jgi:large subunit ribosomal protein L15|uniref:uL15 family ribosomal protein n=1 Tax=Candidatus Nitrosocosmicus sp. FF01 TaxID=3397670 RepID=UPI002ACC3F22|nr:50S ribosomal protein L15 [Candidatus Nitrosocosmicus sp.]
MATRLRKSRKQRGSRYCGWGQIGQHRASGSRGGVGGAGKHKHFFIRTIKEEPNHFGHEQFHALRPSDVQKWVNIKELNELVKFSETDKDGKVVLDLDKLGIGKVLGAGILNSAFTIKVRKISDSARNKIISAGGEVIVLDELNTE